MSESFAEKLIKWYKNHMRMLPWRQTSDPYKIWLSEIILQQTRVQQGLPYYQKFVETYPTVQQLAAAPQEEVLRLWQGLGYYSRARNLHTCAQMVVEEYNGHFPETYNELQKLKGIGKYTAAAIASFAFGQQVPVVDGNVFRVLARYFMMLDDISDTKHFNTFFNASSELMPRKNGDLYNQAMMELGAVVCTPKNPACLLCPIEAGCHAKAEGQQAAFPVKLKKVKVRKRYFYYLVIQHQEQLILKQRGGKDIWEGLFDFPLIESDTPLAEEDLILRIPDFIKSTPTAMDYELSEPVKHILTHQRISAQFLKVEIEHRANIKEKKLKFYEMDEIEELPKPVLINNYLKEKFY